MQNSGLIRIRSFAPITRRGFTGGTLAALLLAGFSSRASAGTTVNFLGWQGYDEGLSIDDFLNKNGITLNTTYIGNNDEIVSKLSAGGVGQVDIVTPYMGYVPLLAASGLIDPIDEALVPNLKLVIEPFLSDPNILVDGKRYAVPFTWGSAPIIYDPAAVTAPTGWADLFKPEYKGKIGMMDDPVGNMTLAAIMTAKAAVPTQLTRDQLKVATDYLIRLKKEQVRVLASSWGDLADALARGDVAVTFNGWEALQKFCADKGKAVSIAYPSEGTYAWLDNYCIAKDAPNRKVAHALANQIISQDAQLKIGDGMLQGIVNKDAIGKLAVSKDLYPYGNLAAFSQTARFMPFPPLEDDGKHATWTEWQEAYQTFKSA